MHSASSQPQSRPSSPGPRSEQRESRAQLTQMSFDKTISNGERISSLQDRDQKQAAKHTLLASAANQNYQRCHRALKSLEVYWEGVKYIITVLDQKAKGIDNPLLYTREEMESALEVPRPEPSFTSPGWRRKLSWGTYLTAQNSDGDMANMPAAIRKGARTPTIPGSPMGLSSQGIVRTRFYKTATDSLTAIGWSLTGTMNSPSTNVAVMYTSENSTGRDPKQAPSKRSPASTHPSIASLISNPPVKFEPSQQPMPSPSIYPPFDPASMPPPPANNSYGMAPTPDPALVSDADLLLNLHSPFNNASPSQGSLQNTTSYIRSASIQSNPPHQVPPNEFSPTFGMYATPSDNTFGDMVIDTQDVDMSVLGADMMPWDLEYLPHDVLYFGDGTFGANDMGGAQQ